MQIQCDKCRQIYEVEDQYAGQQVKCQCGEIITVPKEEKKISKTNQFAANMIAFKAAARAFTSKEEPPPPPTKEKPLQGFVPPLAAKIFDYLMILCIIAVIVAIIAAFGIEQPPVGFIALLGGAIIIFLLYISKLIIVSLAEIAYNTRQIVKGQQKISSSK